jgi:hypothetical protein
MVRHAVAVGADPDQEQAVQEPPTSPVFDLAEELASGVRDADRAWHFIGRFAAACGRPLMGGGCDEAELLEAENRLGLTLPTTMRHLYRLIGQRDDLTSAQDHLLRPDQLRVDESGQVLVFRYENQAVARWGVEIATIEQADPPVVYQSFIVEATVPWQPFLARLSLACLEMVLSEWLMSSEVFHDNRELDNATVAALEHQFSRLPLPDYPMWAAPSGPPTRWFYGMDAVLRDDARTWLWVQAASTDAIDAIRRALPGDWIMSGDS